MIVYSFGFIFMSSLGFSWEVFISFSLDIESKDQL